MSIHDRWNLGEYYDSGESPFYTEFLYKIQEDNPSAGIKHTLENLTEEQQLEIPYLYAHSSQIIEQFNMVYKLHEIGGETEDRWQYLIDKRFMDIKRAYNHYFKLYENEQLDALGNILTESGDRSISSSKLYGSNASGSSSEKYQDTPVTALISTENYATNITDNENENHTSGNETNNIEEEYSNNKVDRNKSNLELTNDNLDIWRDLLTRFVYEFADCFMDEIVRV